MPEESEVRNIDFAKAQYTIDSLCLPPQGHICMLGS